MEGGNTNNYRFLRYFMNGTMDELDPKKEFFKLINFDGAKVVQVAGEMLKVDRTSPTCMLCTLYGGNTCFGKKGNLELVNNPIR